MKLLHRALRPFLSRQFLIFLLVGGAAAVANFVSGALLRLISTSGAAYAASVVAGFAVGTVVSFALNRRFTFEVHREALRPQAARYLLVAIVGLALAALVAELLFGVWRWLGPWGLTSGQAEGWAHLGAIGLVTLFNFLAIKLFAFRTARARSAS